MANTLPNTANHAIQNALDDAAASPGDDLVVVYPGTPATDRANPRGAYYENLIVTTPVKLQGVGPGSPDGARAGLDHRRQRLRRRQPGGRPTGTPRSDPASPGTATRTSTTAPVISIYTHDGARSRPAFKAVDRRLRHPRRRPDGLPEQPQRDRWRAAPDCRPTSSPRAARSSPTPTPAICRSRTTSSRTTAAATARSASARPDLGADAEPQRERPHRQQPDHRQRRHEPGGRRSACSPGPTATTVRRNDICGNFSAEYGGGISASTASARTARSTTTASSSTARTTRAAAS